MWIFLDEGMYFMTSKNNNAADGFDNAKKSGAPLISAIGTRLTPGTIYLTGSVLLIAAWFLVYRNLSPFADLFTRLLSQLTGFSMTSPPGQCHRIFRV